MPNQSGTAEEPSLQAEAVSCRIRKNCGSLQLIFSENRMAVLSAAHCRAGCDLGERVLEGAEGGE